MNRYIPTCLFLISSAVFACEKIDYVEVKDWPVEQIEQTYCADQLEMVGLISRQLNLQDSPYARQYTKPIDTCESQMALYVRVLENVHKRKLPNCKYK
jgi:hypothetical protein